MKLRNKGLALTIVVLALTITLAVYSLPPQSYLDAKRGAYVDSVMYRYIESPDAQLAALLTHEVDASGVPRPEDIGEIMDHGFTITRMPRIGQTFSFPNNRVWPFGVPQADTNHPDFAAVSAFRKAIHRLLDVDDVVDRIYTDPVTGIATMTKAERWMPPAMAKWTAMGQGYGPGNIHTAPDIYTPPFDPCEAADLLDAAGFVQGTTPNPNYDVDFPCSATHMRIDPKTGLDLDFEYYAIGPDESPLGYAMAELWSEWMLKAGVGHHLIAGTWLGMVIRLVNPDLTDFQLMTGVGIIWGVTSPDQWRDFTYSEDIPLWNFALMNFTQGPDHQFCTDHYEGELNQDADYWGTQMMATLVEDEVKHAGFEINEVLRDYEPYRPILEWQLYSATAGDDDPLVPGYTGPGGYRLVNMNGIGMGNTWNRQRMYAGRTDPTYGKINLFIYGSKICSQNPLEADCAVDWGCILGNVYDGFYRITPFERTDWYTGTQAKHESDIWIGPGSSKRESGDGVYNAAVTYDAEGNLATYDGEAIADVTAADLHGDDQLGMVTTWQLRDDLYWHDSDPGPDALFGTGDDGVVHKVTSADIEFALKLFQGQTAASAYENVRYYGTWQHFAGYITPHDGEYGVEIVDDQTFKIYEERRFVFAYQFHDITTLAPKHIWEPYVNAGGDPAAWEGYDRTKATVNKNLLDPVRQRLGLSNMYLTDQIGFGPFVYHDGGWVKGVSTRVEYNPLYYGGNAHPGPADVDMEVYYNPTLPLGKQWYGLVDAADYKRIIDARDNNPGGWGGGMPNDYMWDPTSDLLLPSQIVTLAETDFAWEPDVDKKWGPGYDY